MDADCVTLNKSYRSTYEITTFAQKISPNANLQAIERHGEEPDVVCFKSHEEELQGIVEWINEFADSEYHSMGIICRTQDQAEALFQDLKDLKAKCYLLTSQSDAFRQGVVICTAYMAKGLEFDQVIVPQATADNYKSMIEKHAICGLYPCDASTNIDLCKSKVSILSVEVVLQ